MSQFQNHALADLEARAEEIAGLLKLMSNKSRLLILCRLSSGKASVSELCRTIASSIAGEVAAAYRIPTLTRDVFLDHEQTEEFVNQQFELLIKRAKENGSAIGIGHPHKVTVDYLEKRLPELDEQGIAVATVSGVWAMRNGNRPMFAEGEKRAIRPALAKQE